MDILQNWSEAKSALLEGLTPKQRRVVAPLLENQKTHMINENAAEGSTRGNDIAGFRKILIPMIRRIIPGTIATEIVGVQPMQGPVGLVYSMRFKMAESAGYGRDINGNVVQITAGAEAFGNDHYAFNSNPVYNFYSGAVDNMTGSPAAEAGQAAGASGMGPGAPGDIGANASSASPGVDLESGERWGDITGESAFDGCTSGGHGGTIEGSGGRKMTMEVISQAVEAGTRKLQAGWTIEAMQDLNSQHGLDLENEMTQALSSEIVQEIDSEILSDLIALAGTVASFDGSVAAVGTFGPYAPAYVGDRLANLAVMINYVANEIGRKTRRGVGNFIVVSPLIVSVLQSAAKSVFAPSTEGSFKGPNNTMLVGTLNGTIKVYSYLWNSVQSTDIANGTGNDNILVGYKGGNGETDSGYFYCPYIPLMSSGVVTNPLTYQPSVSLMTRYGKTTFTNSATSLGNSADYYGKVVVTDLSLA